MAQTDIATDETNRLIASNKVEGTNVYNREGEKLGTIYNFMVDKRSGGVEYAVMQFGGLFGLGSDYYPLPWDILAYDPGQGGYVVNLDKAYSKRRRATQATANPPSTAIMADRFMAITESTTRSDSNPMRPDVNPAALLCTD